MPNWKKVITSGSDALLNEITASGGIDTPDITIDDWGSVSASLATLDTLSNPTLQDVTDNGSTTTNSITISDTASIDYLEVNNRLQGNGSGFQFFAYNEDTVKTKFANWYSSNDRQYGMGQLWFETWFAAIDNQAQRDNRRIGFYLEEPDAGSADSGTPGQHPSNSRFYVDINGAYLSGSLNVESSITGSDVTISDWGSVSASLSTLTSDVANIDSNVTLQDATDNGSTTTNNITIDSTGDARLVLDRAANSNDSEIEFKTNGTTNWTIGTGQVGSDNEFTIKGGSTNFVRINESGQADFLLAVTSSDVYIDDWGSVSASLASLDASVYGDSDVTSHINSLNVHSGSHLGTADTDDLPEGSTNLYYTDGRVKTKLNAESVISGSTYSSPLQGTLRATINGVNSDVDLGLQVGDSPTFTDLTLTGNLTVEGTRTELQVTELNVEDKNILVASGALNSAAADGAGITIGGANESLTWDHANSRFTFSDDLRVNNSLNIGSVSNAGTDTDKFLVLDSNGNVDFRTGTEVRSDIGAAGATNVAGAATEIPFFSSTNAVTSSVRLKLNKNTTTGDVLLHHGQINVINDPSVSGTQVMQIIVGSGSTGDVSNPQYDSFLSMEHEGGNGTQVALRANGDAPTAAQFKMRTDVNDAYSIGRLTNPYGANTFRIKPTLIAEGGLSITGSLTISGSNTLRNIGPAEFSGSVKIKTSNQVQASTDTDKFVVLDGQELKYRSGAQVYDDIGVTTLSSSIAADIAALDTSAGGGTIYTSNGNLTGDRAISGVGGSHSLSFNSLESFAINNSAIFLEAAPAIYLANLPAATGSALNNSLYLDTITGELKYASAATLSSITANGASTTNTIRAGGLLVTGSVTISGSNTLINQGPAEFSGSVKVTTADQVQASTDTDKFLVFDGDQIKYRSGAQVRSDIEATSAQNLQSVTDNGSSTTNVITFPNFVLNTPTNNNASSDKILVLDGANRSKFRTRDELKQDLDLEYIVTPLQRMVDCKSLSSGYVPFSVLSDVQSTVNQGFAVWITPEAGYLEKVIVSPEQTNGTTDDIDLELYVDGVKKSTTVSVAMGAAGTNKVFTFGSNYNFTANDRLSLSFDKNTNTADLYSVMLVFRLTN